MRQLRTAVETSPVEEVLVRLGELSPLLRQSAAEAERLARLPKAVVRSLQRSGLFRLWVPKKCAGFELDLPEALEVFAAAARVDGSTGWAVMSGAQGGLFASQVDPVIAQSLFARPESVIATAMAPEGRAVRADGGYRITGCWHYATGAPYATAFLANCTVTESGRPVALATGRPSRESPAGQANTRAVLLESAQVSILPSWDASGLRATGSDDFEVRDVFVPEHRTFALAQPAREPGALYRLPFTAVMELSIVAVALGIAQHALDEFAATTRHRKSPAEAAPLADDPGAQARYAEARATWGLIKAGLDALSGRVWRDALAMRTPSHVEVSEVTAACALSVSKLRSAVSELVALAGMNAIQPDSDLARAWRDLQALAAHTAVSPRNLAKIGATLLAVSDSLGR